MTETPAERIAAAAQPILLGHHSARSALRDPDHIDNAICLVAELETR